MHISIYKMIHNSIVQSDTYGRQSVGETGDWWHCGSQTIHATHHQDEEHNRDDHSDVFDDNEVDDDWKDTDNSVFNFLSFIDLRFSRRLPASEWRYMAGF